MRTEHLVDPRRGDADDDASSTRQHSLLSLAGVLLAETSLPKLFLAWTLLIALPGFLIGVGPLLTSIWLASVSSNALALLTGLGPLLLLALIAAGWFGGRALLRLAESSFWSLNALAVQPGYALCREVIRHLFEMALPEAAADASRGRLRALSAVLAGVVISLLALALVAWAWPSTRWIGQAADLMAPQWLALSALFNGIVLVAGYLAAAALVWGLADAAMVQPHDIKAFSPAAGSGPAWRVAHLSDLHTVGERYGFRIESGRWGPQGNGRLTRLLAQLDRLHAERPLDAILITGDVTDAGSSAEWAAFLDAIAPYPALLERLLLLPGNHDLNIVDRSNPARLDLPLSPKKRLREIRMLSAMDALHGDRVRLVDRNKSQLGPTLSAALDPHRAAIAAFADRAPLRSSMRLANLWATSFPMVLPPADETGLGVIVLDSNVEAHFSFTNALGLVSAEQVYAVETAVRLHPRAVWILALHHHAVEYPRRVKALSERIGTALINGSWFLRRLQRIGHRMVVMHGHRHIDWIGRCGSLAIVSAPSPVMESTDEQASYFYIHTLRTGRDGHVELLEPERIDVPGHAAPHAIPAAE